MPVNFLNAGDLIRFLPETILTIMGTLLMVLEHERQDRADEVEPDRRQTDGYKSVAEATVSPCPTAQNLVHFAGRAEEVAVAAVLVDVRNPCRLELALDVVAPAREHHDGAVDPGQRDGDQASTANRTYLSVFRGRVYRAETADAALSDVLVHDRRVPQPRLRAGIGAVFDLHEKRRALSGWRNCGGTTCAEGQHEERPHRRRDRGRNLHQ